MDSNKVNFWFKYGSLTIGMILLIGLVYAVLRVVVVSVNFYNFSMSSTTPLKTMIELCDQKSNTSDEFANCAMKVDVIYGDFEKTKENSEKLD